MNALDKLADPDANIRPAVLVNEWEYRVESFASYGQSDQVWCETLNKVGAEGWELVAIEDKSRGTVRGFFKRPKRIQLAASL